MSFFIKNHPTTHGSFVRGLRSTLLSRNQKRHAFDPGKIRSYNGALNSKNSVIWGRSSWPTNYCRTKIWHQILTNRSNSQCKVVVHEASRFHPRQFWGQLWIEWRENCTFSKTSAKLKNKFSFFIHNFLCPAGCDIAFTGCTQKTYLSSPAEQRW